MSQRKFPAIVVLLVVGSFIFWSFLSVILPPSINHCKALAKAGQPYAQAICDYQNDHGLLPETFSDLVPGYLPAVPSNGWHYDYDSLYHDAGAPRTEVTYSFLGKQEWGVGGEEGSQLLNVPGPRPTRPPLVGDTLFAARLAEHEKRITRHRSNPGWYESKICFVGLAKRGDLIRTECNWAIGLFPKWWFPRMALAELDGPDSQAGRQFESWVEGHGNYVNYWYLARFYQDMGRTSEAMKALWKMTDCRFEVYPEGSSWIGDALAFDAVQFAYDNREFDLAMALCRQWGAEEHYDNSLVAFEAAIELAQGDFGPAIELARQARRNPGWAECTHDLLQAAEDLNTNFVYDAGGIPSEWMLFHDPLP